MKRAALIVLAAAVAVGGYLLLMRGGDTYQLAFHLPNAHGLRDGAPIVNGGVPIGTVGLDASRDDVEVKLNIDQKYAPVGKDATVTIISQNALGQKQVEIKAGDTSDPAPDGYTLPPSQASANTDLDEFLSTLDPDTRTRLAILINESGTAFTGREMDFKTFLTDIAPAVDHFGNLVGQLAQDNTALENVLATSNGYVGELTNQRQSVARMVDALAGTADTVAVKHAELRNTLRHAPGALTSAQSFLTELRRTTGPLGRTARLLKSSATPLNRTLKGLGPFQKAAKPTLRTAIAVAPDLSRLAKEGTPILQRSAPLLDSLAKLSTTEAPPVSDTLMHSSDNLLATIEGWSRAIQFRDKMGHIFRGEASLSPNFYESMIRRVLGLPPGVPLPGAGTRGKHIGDAQPTTSATTGAGSDGAGTGTPGAKPGAPSSPAPAPVSPNAGKNLLDFLLGG